MDEITLTPAVGGWLHADWGTGKAWIRLGKDRKDKLTRIYTSATPHKKG